MSIAYMRGQVVSAMRKENNAVIDKEVAKVVKIINAELGK
jgi:hypothetical protein